MFAKVKHDLHKFHNSYTVKFFASQNIKKKQTFFYIKIKPILLTKTLLERKIHLTCQRLFFSIRCELDKNGIKMV